MANDLGDLRRSQIITTYGPGAIIDFRAGGYGGAGISVVAAGLDEWDNRSKKEGLAHDQTVFEPRLQKRLEVEGFRLPPVAPQMAPGVYAKNADKLVGVRFPTWLQCPKCHVIGQTRRWREDPGDPALYCGACSEAAGGRNRIHVVPVRFVVVCAKGHLDEFPWHMWVGHRENCTRKKDLKLEGGATAGLAGYILSCTGCGASRPLEGCFGPGVAVHKCSGRRPWLCHGDNEVCDAEPRVVQRGASNIYFSVTESALDIPPWSDALQKKLGVYWHKLEEAATEDKVKAIIDVLDLDKITGLSQEKLFEEVMDRKARLDSPTRNLRWEEYGQFTENDQPFESAEFEIRPAPAPAELAGWFSKVIRATRLREVRANYGFTRVIPPGGDITDRMGAISLEPKNWLPAAEIRGEGIFLQLNGEKLKTWESLPDVVDRAAKLHKEYLESWHKRTGGESDPPRVITPRFLMIHSLAHTLIRQLALDCGYNMASLRERLYVGSGDWDMAGLLIFTASPDADGTLGGLVRQGLDKNIVSVVEGALRSMVWCSSDPLCIQGVHSFTDANNGAACHSCLLAAETSCEEFNGFLDRAMLVGTPDAPDLGFFSDYLKALDE